MRIESSVTSISWIPSEAIEGMPKLPFELGVGRYDAPPPDRVAAGDLERLIKEDRVRETNDLRAWIDVEDGRIGDCGYEGAGLVGKTTFRLGVGNIVFPGVAFETIQHEPELHHHQARFVQTAGGHAGFPAPRQVVGAPYFRITSATAWTTLALTIRADGSSEHELVRASPFPRHWIYDQNGELVHKAGTIDFKRWYREVHGEHTPWSDDDSEAFVTAAESALERRLSRELMDDSRSLLRRKLDPGDTLVEQGEEGEELFLLLDGVLVAEIDGKELAEFGPGSILGERALLEDGTRQATLLTRTRCRVAVVPPSLIDRRFRRALAADPRRRSR